MQEEILLQMKGIDKKFPGVLALNGVDFTLRKGEIHALMGENGAGKSTLIKVLTGVYQKDGGEISLEGQNVSIKSPQDAQNKGISTVYQEITLCPNLTVAENMFIGRENGSWIKRKEREKHADEILGRKETQDLVDNLKKTNETLVEEVMSQMPSVGEVQKVLANLLRERISIRDMSTIFEVLADYARATKDTDILTEYVRHAMARQITQQNLQNNTIPCITLDPALENRIAGAVQRTDRGSYVSLDPDTMQKLLTVLNTELTKLTNMGYQPIVLTSPAVRPYFRKLVERSIEGVIILSHAEIEQSVELQILGVVKI